MNKLLKPIKVLVVDDSPFIRMSLKKILSSDPAIQVVDTAQDGKEGILKLQALKPDVVTMDVEMPVMNGLEALEEIMRWQPTPVIVLSSVTTDGTKMTMKAFDLGAVEVVAKPSGREGDDLAVLAEEIILKIKSVAGVDPTRLNKKSMGSAPPLVRQQMQPTPGLGKQDAGKPVVNVPGRKIEIVAIGTSTGGPSALQNVLSKLPRNFPVPVIVAQHMPAGFTASLASRLNSICEVAVKEVEHGELLKAGTVYIGQAGKQFQVTRNSSGLIANVTVESPIATLYKPSVDVMFLSLAKEAGAGVMGVVMTGMGSDGLAGMKSLKAEGAYAIAESEKTCIIYGMPRAIIEAKLADRVVMLPDIGNTIVECVKRR
ncbi:MULTISPECIES: chemotaxis response regulator protein-glutamate methylesterase [Dehalobacter]|jgi:two-component system chemotaxis response regulator CheB|uniref:Protein-glutamate methylesterase/protein-glutamine glutaminase n=2 Tax=Dehalobacter restrictus TaxID=55583 RepID=A0A857DMB8_9FIRM|nr:MULTISPECIES: chemotaxis response regulator protein-glutamate methylesterase [Dehalobacter]AHF10623.1 chemotaxis protein CheY [Dehalobacter restrictus DSM 9455]MCG1026408.1 chemotaxis response regulator protein-glutamate methylesterase [Dehalobacter sp.]MDJ0306007.1 chemotaxis response regulator protein-glutamate methylesterase [Dehalobacter sp.]OCZ52342.1 chemotaxis response regulator protein-glutamate methylesterase [Dehalobacter sp. TeCB1]QHA01246.1 chemotaxis-specific protein-glutamate 